MTNNPCDQNEISSSGKWLAGLLLIVFILFPIWLIMAFWPDRIPGKNENLRPLYIKELYHIRLACIPADSCCADTIAVKSSTTDSTRPVTTEKAAAKPVDTTTKAKDSAARAADSIKATQLANSKKAIPPKQRFYNCKDLIDLNLLLLILIAAAGFLGNMIHIATSFTAFVGNGQFKRSWILWYTVKPFTGSALALGLYFVFRAGFLNYTADADSINLYGVLTISLLAGLFTDKATLKLAEIFDVVFSVKTGDKRTDKLTATAFKVLSVLPDKLNPSPAETDITIKGENLDKTKLTFKMNGVQLAADRITITPTLITIKYSIPAEQAQLPVFTLTVLDEKNVELCKKDFTV